MNESIDGAGFDEIRTLERGECGCVERDWQKEVRILFFLWKSGT